MGFADLFRRRRRRNHNGKTRAFIVTARDIVGAIAHHERGCDWEDRLAGTVGALYLRKGVPHPPYEPLVRFAQELGFRHDDLLEAISYHVGD